MDDDEKADLARRGIRAAELLEPGAIGRKAKGAVADAAGEAALRGLAAIGRIGAAPRSPARQRAVAAVDVEGAFADWDAADAMEFEKRLRAAAARKQEEDEAARMHLAELRRSFPAQARELALLVFNCVDLLEDLSDDAEGEPAPAPALPRKEALLQRLAEMLAPTAADALKSFVDHVVALSRRRRGE